MARCLPLCQGGSRHGSRSTETTALAGGSSRFRRGSSELIIVYNVLYRMCLIIRTRGDIFFFLSFDLCSFSSPITIIFVPHRNFIPEDAVAACSKCKWNLPPKHSKCSTAQRRLGCERDAPSGNKMRSALMYKSLGSSNYLRGKKRLLLRFAITSPMPIAIHS